MATIVSIERDYSTVEACHFTTFRDQFPAPLGDTQVTPADVSRTVQRLNAFFREAESLDRVTCFEGCFGYLLLYLPFLWYEHRYARVFQRVRAFVESENAQVYNPKRVMLLNPVHNGFLEIEFKLL